MSRSQGTEGQQCPSGSRQVFAKTCRLATRWAQIYTPGLAKPVYFNQKNDRRKGEFAGDENGHVLR